MTQEKIRKRGRPAQLLQMAELHGFVEFLLKKDSRTELQDQVIEALRTQDFNFDLLSEAQQVLVKEALKPYRDHLKLKLLFDELNVKSSTTEYEAKFIQLFELHQNNELDVSDLNILKTMCSRYLNFKAQKLESKDLDFYLKQIQKKDAGKKRKAENQRKFEVGGGVLSTYKAKNDETLDTEKLVKRVNSDRYLAGKLRESKIFNKVWALDLPTVDKYELLFEVLNQLTLYGTKGVTFLNFAIETAQEKLRKERISDN